MKILQQLLTWVLVFGLAAEPVAAQFKVQASELRNNPESCALRSELIFSSQALAMRWLAGGFSFLANPHRRLGPLWRKNFTEPPWRRDRNVLYGGSIIANIGFGLQLVAEPYLVFALTNSASAIGYVTMAIPLGMLFSLFGGMLAGRLSNRGFVVAQFLRAVPPLIVGTWLKVHGSIPPAVIIVCSGLTGVSQAFGFPLFQNMLYSIMEKTSDGEIERASGINITQSRFGQAVGSFLAAFSLMKLGAGPTFLLVAGSYFIFGTVMSLIKTPLIAKVKGAATESLREAIRQDAVFLIFMGLLACATGLGYSIYSLLAPAVKEHLHLQAYWQSRLQSLFTAGALAASIVWISHAAQLYRRRFFLSALILLGGCSFAFSFEISSGMAMVLEGLAGFAYTWAGLVLMGAIQTSVRKDFMPRVFGLLYFFWYGGQAFGNMRAGKLAQVSSVAFTLRSFGAGLIMIAVAFLLKWGKQFKIAQAKGLWAKELSKKFYSNATAPTNKSPLFPLVKKLPPRLHVSLFAVTALLLLSPIFSSGWGLVSGVAFALVFGNPAPARVERLSKKLLPLSVIGLGAGMNLLTVASVGFHGALYTVTGIGLTLLLGRLLRRVFGVESVISLLITVGTAICGGSAIAAVAPVIGAEPEEISVAIGIVFLLNSFALFLFPWLGHIVGLDSTQFGYWCALAIHDTSSVVGAAARFSDQSLAIATTVKLARALWIVPVTLVIGAWFERKNKTLAGSTKPKKPWFILGFIFTAALATWIPFLHIAGSVVFAMAKRSLVLVLFLIGSGKLRKVGWRPFVQAVTLWLIVAAATLAAIVSGWIGGHESSKTDLHLHSWRTPAAHRQPMKAAA